LEAESGGKRPGVGSQNWIVFVRVSMLVTRMTISSSPREVGTPAMTTGLV
jgi:hypothetical protein